MTPKNAVRLTAVVEVCDQAISQKGAYARVIVRLPGTWGKRSTRKFVARGPRGKITMQTHDRKKILVMFYAAKLKTILEEMLNAKSTN